LLREAHELLNYVPKHRLLFYAEEQDIYDEMLDEGLITEKMKYLPPLQELKGMLNAWKSDGESLLIIDDMNQIIDLRDVEALFTRLRSHMRCSVIYLSQVIFLVKSPSFRVMSVNSQYQVVFKSPRDTRSIMTLATQVMSERPKYLVDAYKKATKEPYQPLILDYTMNQADIVRLRSHIFSKPHPPIAYIPS